MASGEVHKNDIGTLFLVTIYDGAAVVDISGATTKQILFRKPTATILTKTASFTTDGTDGQIDYTTISGDLDTTGTWEIQAKVITSAGTWFSDKGSFEVYPNVE